MCGIAGIIVAPSARVPPGALDAMTDALTHRGPDARGVWSDAAAGVHFGHRRLSILDLSPGGAQPMASGSGRQVIVLNGEIYNYRQLRADLDREATIAWRGTSDTEVLVELIDRYGPEQAVARLEGMFAFAVWNRETGEVTLARDRFGEKPLYVAEVTGGILFASELGSILTFPDFDGCLDEHAADLFLQLSYIPEPLTPFRTVTKLPGGHLGVLRPGSSRLDVRCYWNPFRAALDARIASITAKTTAADAIAAVESRLAEVVSNQMVADVPLGAFLSGGIDSSLVVALMQKASARPVRTFTIGFRDEAYDEATHARAVARHLGTDHTEAILDWREALDLVDRMATIYSEPFADSSQLPTFLVSRIARRVVTVCLSGDGGDEVFGGYNRHAFAARFEPARAMLPAPLRTAAGRALTTLAAPRHANTIETLRRGAGFARIGILAEKLDKLGSALGAPGDAALYAGLVRRDGGRIAGTLLENHLAPLFAALANRGHGLAETMMLLDTATYLPGDILAKVDRAAMACSLEARIPYLDHRLFELTWKVPIEARISRGRSKAILRKMLEARLPAALFERPKAGFGVPIDAWMRGPLSTWIDDRIGQFARLYPRHAAAAQSALTEFRAGRSHAHHFLWNAAALAGWRTAHAKANGL